MCLIRFVWCLYGCVSRKMVICCWCVLCVVCGGICCMMCCCLMLCCICVWCCYVLSCVSNWSGLCCRNNGMNCLNVLKVCLWRVWIICGLICSIFSMLCLIMLVCCIVCGVKCCVWILCCFLSVCWGLNDFCLVMVCCFLMIWCLSGLFGMWLCVILKGVRLLYCCWCWWIVKVRWVIGWRLRYRFVSWLCVMVLRLCLYGLMCCLVWRLGVIVFCSGLWWCVWLIMWGDLIWFLCCWLNLICCYVCCLWCIGSLFWCLRLSSNLCVCWKWWVIVRMLINWCLCVVLVNCRWNLLCLIWFECWFFCNENLW